MSLEASEEIAYYLSPPAGDSGVAFERLKIGGGTPPVATRHGWMIIYHGVSKMATPGNDDTTCATRPGVMLLSREHPQVIRYRSAEPVLTPQMPEERRGIIANVVFRTAIDRRDDLCSPDRFDVYYGMVDYRIRQLSRCGRGRLRCPNRWNRPASRWPLTRGAGYTQVMCIRIVSLPAVSRSGRSDPNRMPSA